jgi:iron complex transport system substrate-binding protein
LRKSTTDKDKWINGIPVIRIPVKNIVITASPHTGMLKFLGQINVITGVDDLSNVYDNSLRDKIQRGEVKQVGSPERLSVETLVSLHPELVVVSGSNQIPQRVLSLSEMGIPVLYTWMWRERTPLGRADWIKCFGALTGQEFMADSIFAEVDARYTEMKTIASGLSGKPKVLSGQMWKGTWYAPGGGSYFARIMQDAGCRYAWSDTPQNGSLSLDFEEVLARQADADIWLNPGLARSIGELLELDERLKSFKSVRHGQVFSYTAVVNEAGVNAYWEEAGIIPHYVLSDLLCIFHPEEFAEKEMYYYRKLDP